MSRPRLTAFCLRTSFRPVILNGRSTLSSSNVRYDECLKNLNPGRRELRQAVWA